MRKTTTAKNMRGGFTMIELVFVIVIIGILSAVALPKFMETANQAHDSKVKAFAGTLNRTTGPTLWSKSLAEGKNGSVADYCGDIASYVEVPEELTDNGDCTFTHKDGSGATLDITFTDGDATKSPRWATSS